MNTPEILRKAADLISERGLAKWIREDSAGRLCLIGAIQMAQFGEIRYSRPGMEKVLSEILSPMGGWLAKGDPSLPQENWIGNCAAWNNRSERTADDVIHALKLYAEEVELQEA